jgi:hypothetical protein
LEYLFQQKAKINFIQQIFILLSFKANCGLCGVQEVRVIVQIETTWANLIVGAAVPKATQQGNKLIFLKPFAARGEASPWFTGQGSASC